MAVSMFIYDSCCSVSPFRNRFTILINKRILLMDRLWIIAVLALFLAVFCATPVTSFQDKSAVDGSSTKQLQVSA